MNLFWIIDDWRFRPKKSVQSLQITIYSGLICERPFTFQGPTFFFRFPFPFFLFFKKNHKKCNARVQQAKTQSLICTVQSSRGESLGTRSLGRVSELKRKPKVR